MRDRSHSLQRKRRTRQLRRRHPNVPLTAGRAAVSTQHRPLPDLRPRRIVNELPVRQHCLTEHPLLSPPNEPNPRHGLQMRSNKVQNVRPRVHPPERLDPPSRRLLQPPRQQ